MNCRYGTRLFTIQELRIFFRTFDITDMEECRTRLYFLAQYYFGGRKKTIDLLNIYNVMWEDRVYYVRGDKGHGRYSNNGERALPIPYELFYHLNKHCEENLERIKQHNGFIFYPDLNDVPAPTKYQRLFRKHVHLAGLERAYTINAYGQPRYDLVTHSFRKSYATYLLNNGCELPTLMELLGHTTLHSTHKYLRLTTRRKKDIVSKIFDGKIIQHKFKPLILCEDTPYIETDEDIVNVAITKKQLELLVKLGIIDEARRVAMII